MPIIFPGTGASPSFDQYQSRLLGDKATCVNNIPRVVMRSATDAIEIKTAAVKQKMLT